MPGSVLDRLLGIARLPACFAFAFCTKLRRVCAASSLWFPYIAVEFAIAAPFHGWKQLATRMAQGLQLACLCVHPVSSSSRKRERERERLENNTEQAVPAQQSSYEAHLNVLPPSKAAPEQQNCKLRLENGKPKAPPRAMLGCGPLFQAVLAVRSSTG